jgi:hypothetical protein
LAEFSTVEDGGFTTSPPPTAPSVTVIEFEVKVLIGLITTIASGPGPLAVLHVSATFDGVAVN